MEIRSTMNSFKQGLQTNVNNNNLSNRNINKNNVNANQEVNKEQKVDESIGGKTVNAAKRKLALNTYNNYNSSGTLISKKKYTMSNSEEKEEKIVIVDSKVRKMVSEKYQKIANPPAKNVGEHFDSYR